ncbi:MAG TPA: FAD-binding oxidoreductase [Candidatus Limnocylindria bacterium]|nr:FAD-binding oxidoreductase [Candidatus Limnocylindria bacterium]
MATTATISGFGGELIRPGDAAFDQHREVWNAMVDRRPQLIARCRSVTDVVAAMSHARDNDLEIAVKCGGHSIVGFSVPDDGLMIDLSPMSEVHIDANARRAHVQGGSLLRNLDRAAEPHGLATTAGNVSHTGVGGLTLGGGMGWLARQFGLACDNVASYTVVTADGEVVRATAEEHPDLFWGLRGGGGNFGIVTEFEFRLHPLSHTVLAVDRYFDAQDAPAAIRAWRDLLADAPRQATLTVDAVIATPAGPLPDRLHGRPVVSIGFIWVGDLEEGRRYLDRFRDTGEALAENVEEMRYVDLQSIADDVHHHGKRRYMKGHYLADLSDPAIEAFLRRGVPSGAEPDWNRIPNGGLVSYGGAIGDVADDDAAFSHRRTLVEWGGSITWLDAAEDEERIAAARSYGRAMEPFATGVYVNTLVDEGEAGVRRAYNDAKLARLAQLKRRYDPDNVFHLNANITPASD